MRRKIWLVLLLLLVPVFSRAEPAPERKLTVMVYMCGSNLESEYGSATADLREMLEAGPDPDTALLVMTGGSDITGGGGYFRPEDAGIYEIRSGRIRRVWQPESPMNMGEGETLARLLQYGAANRPAERYALILWNHGGGPLEGVCWDELFSLDSLALSELTAGIEGAGLGRKLSWIGFDACLMSSVEVASALVPYAEYMIASQETEPASGWDYSFLREIGQDADGAAAGRRIVDAYFSSLAGSSDHLTMACTDLGRIPDVAERMGEYFLPISERLSPAVFRELSGLQKETAGFGKAVRGISDSSYDLMDLKDLVSRFGEGASPLNRALEEAVVYSRSNETGANGLSVYHPYANKKKYLEKWREGYKNLHFCSGYTVYQERFGSLLTGESLADWRGLRIAEQWSDGQDTQHFTLQLTPEQVSGFSSAQMIILENIRSFSEDTYSPVSVENAVLAEDGTLSASYSGTCLCVTDDEGEILAGPVSYMLSEDGETYSIETRYFDYSGRPDGRSITPVMFECVREEGSGRLRIERTYTYDRVSGTYTNRIAFTEEDFTDVLYYLQLRYLPEGQDPLRGFDEWEEFRGYLARTIPVPASWHFTLVDRRKLGNLYVMFQVTDLQQNTYASLPVRIDSPWESEIRVIGDGAETAYGRFRLSGILKNTEEDAGIELALTVENNTDKTMNYIGEPLVLNGERTVYLPYSAYDVAPGDSQTCYVTLEDTDLRGLQEITRIDFPLYGYGDDYNRHTFTASFSLEDTDVGGIAPPVPETLDEGDTAGLHWKLVSFEQDENGNFNGLLQIRNDTDQYIERIITPLVNRVQTESVAIIRVQPHTEAFFSFQMKNQVLLDRIMFDISGDPQTNYMSIGQAAGRTGKTSAEEVDLVVEAIMLGDEAPTETVSFRLPEPFPLASAGYALPDFLPLLEGEVSVRLEGAFTGDEGAALALELANDTDEPVCLAISGLRMNGSEADFGNITADSTELPARSKAILILKVVNDSFADEPAVPANGRLETVSLCFGYGETVTGPAVITFPDQAFLGKEGGEYFPAGRLTVKQGW